MNTKDNRRAQQTRARIESVFLSLLSEKPTAKITVQEICRGAQVNRTTFYAHYQDIFQLFESMENALAEHIERIFAPTPPGEEEPTTFDRYVALFTYVQQNATFFRAFLHETAGDGMFRHHISRFSGRVMDRFTPAQAEAQPEAAAYRMAYYSAGISAIIKRWLDLGCPQTPVQLLCMISDTGGLGFDLGI